MANLTESEISHNHLLLSYYTAYKSRQKWVDNVTNTNAYRDHKMAEGEIIFTLFLLQLPSFLKYYHEDCHSGYRSCVTLLLNHINPVITITT